MAVPEAPMRLISDGETFSVHSYFDVCPESPDGSRVVYSRFTGGPPGRRAEAPSSGQVIVADRDGGDARVVGQFAAQIGHTGAFAMWLDDDRLAYQDGATLHVHDLASGSDQTLTAACHSVHPTQGALFSPHVDNVGHSSPLADGMYHLDTQTLAIRPILTLAELAELPLLRDVPERENWALCHPKWSADGGRAAVLLSVRENIQLGPRIHYLLTCRPDGSDLRHFAYQHQGQFTKPMHFHFFDDQSIYGYDIADPERPCRIWDLDGKPLDVFHHGPGNHASMSPDRHWCVTDSWYQANPERLMFYRRGDSEPTVIMSTPPHPRRSTDIHPALSRDGRRVYANHFGIGGQDCQVVAYDLDQIPGLLG